jgi:molybdopterin/thiamine biosynthesis adenylyltransferase
MGEVGAKLSSSIPERDAEVIVYCAHGYRSADVTLAMQEAMGYTAVANLAGGIDAWERAGLPVEANGQNALTAEHQARYARQIALPELGVEGQKRLGEARVLVLGAGGLGALSILYLSAAGVGKLGVVDFDVVELSNLQRQVIHSTSGVGASKVESAKAAIKEINPTVEVDTYDTKLDSSNVLEILSDYDLVIDGLDNFPARYLVNDASVRLGIPVVYASVLRFEGQLSVFFPGEGPCYRCLFPSPPSPEMAPSCGEAGVLGAVPGVLGVLQATEAIKLIAGIGEPLIGRLLLYDALAATFSEVQIARDPQCPICSLDPQQITDDQIGVFPDYEAFCAGGANGSEPQ